MRSKENEGAEGMQKRAWCAATPNKPNRPNCNIAGNYNERLPAPPMSSSRLRADRRGRCSPVPDEQPPSTRRSSLCRASVQECSAVNLRSLVASRSSESLVASRHPKIIKSCSRRLIFWGTNQNVGSPTETRRECFLIVSIKNKSREGGPHVFRKPRRFVARNENEMKTRNLAVFSMSH
jgi:hypothetical protein